MARAKAKPAEAVPPPQPPVNTLVTHTVGLDAIDWYLAPWRQTPPLARPAPTPFVLDDCLSRLNRVKSGGYSWNWHQAHIADVLSREEAHFWLFALTGAANNIKARELGQSLAREHTFDGKLTRKEIVARLNQVQGFPDEQVLAPLANLFSAEELVGLLLSDEAQVQPSASNWNWGTTALNLAETFSRRILPYLSEPERAKIRAQLQGKIDPGTWPRTQYGNWIPFPVYLAALVGMPQEMRAVVRSWDNDHFSKGYAGIPQNQQPQRVLYGLDEPKEVAQHLERLKLRTDTPYLIRGWLAQTELTGLEIVRDTILANTDKSAIERLMEPFGRVLAPRRPR